MPLVVRKGNPPLIAGGGSVGRRPDLGLNRKTGPGLASPPSRRPKLPIGQAFNAISSKEAVAVEQLVDLPPAVALLPPERPQYRPVAGGGDGVGEVLRTGGIEGDGRNVAPGNGTGHPGDIGHFDDLDGRREDPLKLGDA